MTVVGNSERMTAALAAANGKLAIANCRECPFASQGVRTICDLTVESTPAGGVRWRYVHGNSAPPSWCPIRKYNGIALTVKVEPSPDHWHHG